MPTPIGTVRDVIMKLGGADRVAGRTGFDVDHVLVWLRRGWFPAQTFGQIMEGLLEQDCTTTNALFGPPAVSTEKNILPEVNIKQTNTFPDAKADAPL